MSWQLDLGHTYIGFTGRHLMVATVRGEFEKFSGTVEFDEQDITRSKADIQIEAASVNTRNAQRDEHFRSADFFDVEHYPYITFKSKRVVMQSSMAGELTRTMLCARSRIADIAECMMPVPQSVKMML